MARNPEWKRSKFAPFDKIGDLDYLIGCGHHQLTSYEVAELLKRHLGTETVALAATLPDKLYTTTNHTQVFLMQRLLPSGKQADVVFWAQDRTAFASERIFAGSYDRLFLLDELLTARLGVTQQMVVEAALLRDLSVPVKVRIEHPQLFVTIPARFGKLEGARAKVIDGLLLTRDSLTTSAIERVKNALSPDWFRGAGPCTVAKVQAWIEESHRTIQRMSCDRTRAATVSPTCVQDWDRLIADQTDNIEFYRWLEPLVAPGGVFFNPEEESHGP
jgi:hypothetical protein